jgi:hypothetical protein
MVTTKRRPFYCVKPVSGARRFFVMTHHHPDNLGRVPLARITNWNLCRYQLKKDTDSIMTEDMAFHWNFSKEAELVEGLFRL